MDNGVGSDEKAVVCSDAAKIVADEEASESDCEEDGVSDGTDVVGRDVLETAITVSDCVASDSRCVVGVSDV